MKKMEKIRVDRESGNVVLLQVLNEARPGLHRQSTSRLLRRVLAKFPIAKMRINSTGNPNIVGSLEACMHLLNHIPGEGWDKWRRESGSEFKQALSKYVEEKITIQKTKPILKIRETSVRDKVAELHHGRKEVWTPSGVIDVLTEDEVIEIKYYKNWQRGMGQVLAYGSHYTDRAKRLHLFAHNGDNRVDEFVSQATSVCTKYGVQVTLHKHFVDSCSDSSFDSSNFDSSNFDSFPRKRPQDCKSLKESLTRAKIIKRTMDIEMGLTICCKKLLETFRPLADSEKVEFSQGIKESYIRAQTQIYTPSSSHVI